MITRTVGKKTMKETSLKFCKVLVVQMLLYGSETPVFKEDRLE
jgi:hypothetical protein